MNKEMENNMPNQEKTQTFSDMIKPAESYDSFPLKFAEPHPESFAPALDPWEKLLKQQQDEREEFRNINTNSQKKQESLESPESTQSLETYLDQFSLQELFDNLKTANEKTQTSLQIYQAKKGSVDEVEQIANDQALIIDMTDQLEVSLLLANKLGIKNFRTAKIFRDIKLEPDVNESGNIIYHLSPVQKENLINLLSNDAKDQLPNLPGSLNENYEFLKNKKQNIELAKYNIETQAMWKDLEAGERTLVEMGQAKRMSDPEFVMQLNELRELYSQNAIAQLNSLISIANANQKAELTNHLQQSNPELFDPDSRKMLDSKSMSRELARASMSKEFFPTIDQDNNLQSQLSKFNNYLSELTNEIAPSLPDQAQPKPFEKPRLFPSKERELPTPTTQPETTPETQEQPTPDPENNYANRINSELHGKHYHVSVGLITEALDKGKLNSDQALNFINQIPEDIRNKSDFLKDQYDAIIKRLNSESPTQTIRETQEMTPVSSPETQPTSQGVDSDFDELSDPDESPFGDDEDDPFDFDDPDISEDDTKEMTTSQPAPEPTQTLDLTQSTAEPEAIFSINQQQTDQLLATYYQSADPDLLEQALIPFEQQLKAFKNSPEKLVQITNLSNHADVIASKGSFQTQVKLNNILFGNNLMLNGERLDEASSYTKDQLKSGKIDADSAIAILRRVYENNPTDYQYKLGSALHAVSLEGNNEDKINQFLKEINAEFTIDQQRRWVLKPLEARIPEPFSTPATIQPTPEKDDTQEAPPILVPENQEYNDKLQSELAFIEEKSKGNPFVIARELQAVDNKIDKLIGGEMDTDLLIRHQALVNALSQVDTSGLNMEDQDRLKYFQSIHNDLGKFIYNFNYYKVSRPQIKKISSRLNFLNRSKVSDQQKQEINKYLDNRRVRNNIKL